ncbi:hypothetical protein N7G274_004728 [Stereocaulon virgatum]|uniref:Uncharacterized protein n=1 Tax=Stereocaulon virgatum TaxID=373712 RepID=A0ABR4AAW9_9LECA
MSPTNGSEAAPQKRTSSEATVPMFPTFPASKAHAAWKTFTSRLKGKSAPDLRRWSSYSRASEPDKASVRDEQRPEDEENSHFCESLLGLMKRSSRFDYLAITKEEKVNKQENKHEQEQSKTIQVRRAKRFSWAR